jgi:hypothetical protein
MNSGSKTDNSLMLLKVAAICIVLLSINSLVQAQTDTTYSYVWNGVERKFTFIKSDNGSQLQKIPAKSFPVYSVNRKEYTTIRLLLGNFVDLAGNYSSLNQKLAQRDSLFSAKEQKLDELRLSEQARAQNFEKSTNDLLRLNEQLNQQLKNCETLAKTQRRKRSLRSAVIGALIALPAGVIIGVVAD